MSNTILKLNNTVRSWQSVFVGNEQLNIDAK